MKVFIETHPEQDSKFFQLLVVLATVPGCPAAFLVWNRTGCSGPGVYPELRGTQRDRGRVWSAPRFHLIFATPMAQILYLSFDCIMTWSIYKVFSFGRSFTSSIQICNPTEIRWTVAKLAGYWSRHNEYWSHCKPETGRWKSDRNCTIYVLIILWYDHNSNT
jgi:hypothetical protein